MRPQATTRAAIACSAIVAMVVGTRLEIRGAQTPAPTSGTGVLLGVIVDALDNKPVANAEVTLGGAPPALPNTQLLTDAEGQFVFMDLPAGTYTITATKAGYADGAYGRLRPAGLTQSLLLANGDRLGDVRIPMWKYGAITGTVRDEVGESMVLAPVRVLTRTIVAGERKLSAGALVRTDDRGIYRFNSLTPGDYIVAVPSTQASAPESVVELYRSQQGRGGGSDFSPLGATETFALFLSPGSLKVGGFAFVSSSASGLMRAGVAPMPSSDGRVFVYPTQYHTAARFIAEATTVTVRSGEEVPGVDVQLKLSPSSRVSGVVTGPDGPVMAALYLAPDTNDLSTDTSFETATTVSDATGRFSFLGVPAGQYQLHALRAQAPPRGGTRGGQPAAVRTPAEQSASAGYTWSAAQPISVSSTDLDGLAVTLRPGFRISGVAEFKGSTLKPPDPTLVRRMSVAFDSPDARPPVLTALGRGQFQDDGQVSSNQLTPGRYY